MSAISSPAKAGAQTPEGPSCARTAKELPRFACNDWAPAFAGEQAES